jgi:hypothetical protein
MDQGEELIPHSAELDVVRRQASRVHLRALIAGSALTLLAVVLAIIV